MATQSFLLPRMMPRDQVICRIVDALEDLPATLGYRVEVREHQATRTEQQNNALWWVYGNILKLGGEMMGGYSKEELHEVMLEAHFGVETRVVLGRELTRPRRRSSKLSKLEFAEFFDFIYRFMAEQGVYLPDPDPEYAIHREKKAA